MSALLSADDFSPHVGQAFVAGASAPALELELLSVTPAGGCGPDGRQGFTLLFRGPPQPVLPQGIQLLQHPSLVETGIFLVPLGPDALGMQYEAIFN